MDIVVFGASGRVGSAIVQEALKENMRSRLRYADRKPSAFSMSGCR